MSSRRRCYRIGQGRINSPAIQASETGSILEFCRIGTRFGLSQRGLLSWYGSLFPFKAG